MAASSPQPSDYQRANSAPPAVSHPTQGIDDGINLRETILKLGRGLDQILGLALLGAFIAGIICLIWSPFLPQVAAGRISFSFPGYDRGEYPDHSKFQPDDLRSPEIVTEAIQRLNLPTTAGMQSDIRAGISIEGIIPPEVVRDRDRLRAAGQPVPPYVPDELKITLSLPRKFPLTPRQRESLLSEILNVYKDSFRRTYIELPLGFGNAFAALKDADYFDYEMILRDDLMNLESYLEQQADKARTFRSKTTNLSFADLLTQTQLFSQIRLNEVLGLIQANGLSTNRQTAMVKINYYLSTLTDRERIAIEQDRVVTQLLERAQERTQNYVLGIRNEAAQPKSNAPILNQGLIDSLIANDGYNFLLHRALESGTHLKDIQSQIAQVKERQKIMEQFEKEKPSSQADVTGKVEASMKSAREEYDQLVSLVRKTYLDFANQQFGNAVRFVSEVRTTRLVRPLAQSLGIGAALGLLLGCASTLLGFSFVRVLPVTQQSSSGIG